MFEQKPLPYAVDSIAGISPATFAMHHDTLYAGYVKKSQDIERELAAIAHGEQEVAPANATYSPLRSLKDAEIFAQNGVFLHEAFFASLAAESQAQGPLVDALAQVFGSLPNFLAHFAACGLAARGWTLLAWDTLRGGLHVYNADAHHQGGVWGAMPLLVLDVYEHAYVGDYGADRKAYIETFLRHINWAAATERYLAVRDWHMSY
jgi:Fe-Mn family superoxide dismutase